MKKIFILCVFSLLVMRTCIFSHFSIKNATAFLHTETDINFLKWSEHQDNVLVYGTVVKHEYYGMDEDWILEIKPDTNCLTMLNNLKGEMNANRIIETEIEPLDNMGSKANEKKFFAPLLGKKVWIMGTWVDDNGHECKTELHPITGIVAIDNDTVKVFAFLDDSWNFVTKVPHSGENRIFDLQLPFPQNYQAIQSLSEVNLTQKRDITFSHDTLSIHIETGCTKEKQGFYYGEWLLTN